MSKSIDERVVEMQFNNKQFESGIKESLSSLDNLKKGLNDTGGKNSGLAGIAEGVETVASKFSALGVIAITALVNITNKVIELGMQMVRSLTLEPIGEGFKEYELKMGAIQTIMAGTGESLPTVNKYLEELNSYADRTIYSFADMTQNIGKFTNAGVGLEDAVGAIQGVANVAAISGANTNEASRAMYNFAQALSAGYVKLIDWKSIENANMATKEFKQQLLDSAVALGTATKTADGMYNVLGKNNQGKTMKSAISATKNFNDSLQFQWMTTEVLVDTLGRYSDETTDIGKRAFAAAQDIKTFTMLMDTLKEAAGSGWAKSFEIIIGDFEVAKTLFTNLGTVIGGFLDKSADARNEMLQFWADNGGRTAAIEALKNAFEAFNRVITPIKEAFNNFFPPMTGERLVALSVALRDFTEHLKIGAETSDKLKRIFSGLFATLDLAGQGFKFLFNVARELFSLFGGPSVRNISDAAANLGDFLVKLNQSAKEGEIFERAFTKVKEVFTTVANVIKTSIEAIKIAIEGFRSIDISPIGNFADRTHEKLKPLETIGKIFSAIFNAIVTVLKWATPIVLNLAGIASKALGGLAEKITYAVKNMDFTEILGLLNAGLFSAILLGFKNFIKSITGITSEAGGFLSGITGILDGVRSSLETWQNNLRAKTLLTIAIAVGVLAGALLLLSTIPSDKLQTGLAGMTVIFTELTAALIILQTNLSGTKMSHVSTQLLALSASILILTVAMKQLAELDWEGIAKGTIGIGILMAELVIAAKVLSANEGTLIKGSVGLVVFAASILVLTQSVKQLSELDLEALAKGLGGVGILIAELVIFMKLTEGLKSGVLKGLGLIALAAAIKILASAVEDFGRLSVESLAKGLAAIGIVLTELAVFMKLTGNAKHVITTATGMVILAAALVILQGAVEKFGNMQWDEIARGLTAMAGALAAITIAMNLLPKNMVGKSIGLIGVATALQIMVKPIQDFGGMEWESIAKGLVALAGSLTVIAVALNLMQKAIPGAAAMLIVAPALALMAVVLKDLGDMSLQEIGIGLLALAGIFVVFGAAGAILQPLVPTLIGLGTAILLLGAGVGLAGVGILALSAGLTALSIGATAAAGAIVVIGSAILSLIPLLFQKLGEGLVELGKAIINGAPILGEAFVTLVKTALESLDDTIPIVTKTFLKLLLWALTEIDANLPEIVDKVVNIIIGVLDKLADRLPELIKAAAKVIGAFLEGLFNAMGGYNPENMFELLGCITLLIAAFTALALAKKVAKDAIITAGAMAAVMLIITAMFVVIAALDIDSILEISLGLSAIILSISGALVLLTLVPIPAALTAVASLGIFVAGLAVILAAMGGLKQIPGLDWIVSEGAALLKAIGTALGDFAGSIVGGFLETSSASFPQIGKNLSEFMNNVKPFIEGIKTIDSSAMNGVTALASTVLILTAANVLDGLTSWLVGGSSMAKFGEELAKFAPYFVDYYNQIKGVDSSVVQASGNAALALAEFAAKIPNTGGLLAKIVGENSIITFAEELQKFAPHLMAYAESVEGLNADVVINSANAALALAEFASKLPNQGGVAAWFAGENTLSIFAEELVKFGPALKAYADSVVGLDGAVVVNSMNAALTISEFAKTLPNQGGVAAWFAGENSLSIFAEELVKFGPALKSYANSIAGLDGSVVVNSANAAKALAELANNLPNQGGVAAWFAGENTMATFGENLYQFGWYFRLYYDQIAGISFPEMNGVLMALKALIDLCRDVQSANVGGLTSFATDLNKAGQMGVKEFLAAFDNSVEKARASASKFVTAFVTEFSNNQPKVTEAGRKIGTAMETGLKTNQAAFGQLGTKCATDFITSFTNKQSGAQEAGRIVGTAAETGLKTNIAIFSQVGSQNGLNYMQGLQSYQKSVLDAGRNLTTSALNGLKSNIAEFKSTGEQAGKGFRDGLLSMIKEAGDAAKRLASEAAKAAKAALQVASPSKLFYWIATMTGEGFVNGLTDMVRNVGTSASALGNSAVTSIKSAISQIADATSGDLSLSPIIRPVVDLNEVQNGITSIDKLLGTKRNLDLSVSQNKARIVAGEISRGRNSQNNDQTGPRSDEKYSFVQNNYSPKALSKLEIYRQTRNQFAQLKAQVEGV